jgi:hypothetical protein
VVLVRLFVEQRYLVRQANMSAGTHVAWGLLQHNKIPESLELREETGKTVKSREKMGEKHLISSNNKVNITSRTDSLIRLLFMTTG